jgi:nitric oxide reductase NorE protein
MGDMVMFAMLFGVFLYYRAENHALFTASQGQLNKFFGAANLLLLLTSSWFVALALHCVRLGRGRLGARFYGLALACGLGFVIIKVLEYSEKLAGGITLLTNTFYTYYFILTGIHFMHLNVGLGVLIYLMRSAKRINAVPLDTAAIEAGSAYWHLVDLLWVVLFPLIYLVR